MPDDVDRAQLERYLGPLELRIMLTVWQHGPSTVGEVLEQLNRDSAKSLVYNTVMTTLTRLADKGYLHRRRDGRAYRYDGDGPEAFLQARAADATRDLVESLGTVGVAGIMDGLGTTDETRALMRRMLDDDG